MMMRVYDLDESLLADAEGIGILFTLGLFTNVRSLPRRYGKVRFSELCQFSLNTCCVDESATFASPLDSVAGPLPAAAVLLSVCRCLDIPSERLFALPRVTGSCDLGYDCCGDMEFSSFCS